METQTKAKILVVDDVALNRALMSGILRKGDWIVETADNGENAFEKVKASSYEAILMDVQMPVLDGIQATERIRAYEQSIGRYTPIVAITALPAEEHKMKCLEAGMDYFINKPVSGPDLIALFKEIIEKHSTP
jgi:CheY-like chemotaxis protein